MCVERAQRGLTLIESIVFIVIVSVGLVGVLSVLNLTARSSSDPLIRKQMLAIAEAVLEEVQLQPFTWCDPDDRNAANATEATLDPAATNPAHCWDAVEAPDAEAGEVRGHAVTPFDNVNDYAGEAVTANISGMSMPAGYAASVAVSTDANFGAAGSPLPANEVLRITVTVTHGTDSLSIDGYRTRYSPNTLP